MILGKVRLNGRAVLAPLAGVTDSSFRLLCKKQGAALVFSEMVSADGLVRNDRRTKQYISFTAEERPIGIQLFGNDPFVMAEAAKHLESISPDFIDLNFGCPVKKVIKRKAGAAILKDLSLLRSIASAVTQSTPIPVLAKIRCGWDESQNNAVEVAGILEESGVSAITIHPRFQSQLYRGFADWEIIRQVKQRVSIPVIGNGDIKTPQDAKRMLDETGCDLIMIGRAALGNPWIFNQINDYLEERTEHRPITLNQRLNMCLSHLDMMVASKGYHRGIREMRKHFIWYFKGLPDSASLKVKIVQMNDIEQVKEELCNFFTERIPEYV